jgi:two-component system response regulator NreC
VTELLIVDHDDPLRSRTERIVRERGYGCDAATNASDARELLIHDSYQLVLLDIDIPDEPGIDLLTHIRGEHPNAAVVVIGEDDPNLAKAAIELGAVGYMVKPVGPGELLVNVANALYRGSLEPELRASQSPRTTARHPYPSASTPVLSRKQAVPSGATVTQVAHQGRQTTESQTAHAQQTIRVVLADDHAVVRSGLKLLLESESDLEVVAEAGDVEDAQRYVRGHRPAVLVLDLNMPGGSSLEAIPDIREHSPDTQIVVLTMQQEPAFARHALSAGAIGYVLKEAADDELVEAVRRAARSESYLNPRLGARLASEPTPGPPDDLSEREVDVLRLIALGHTNAEIAEKLFLSVRTVETHRAHIQQKLNLSSRAELVAYALKRGLINAP